MPTIATTKKPAPQAERGVPPPLVELDQPLDSRGVVLEPLVVHVVQPVVVQLAPAEVHRWEIPKQPQLVLEQKRQALREQECGVIRHVVGIIGIIFIMILCALVITLGGSDGAGGVTVLSGSNPRATTATTPHSAAPAAPITEAGLKSAGGEMVVAIGAGGEPTEEEEKTCSKAKRNEELVKSKYGTTDWREFGCLRSREFRAMYSSPPEEMQRWLNQECFAGWGVDAFYPWSGNTVESTDRTFKSNDWCAHMMAYQVRPIAVVKAWQDGNTDTCGGGYPGCDEMKPHTRAYMNAMRTSWEVQPVVVC